jgi:phospholipase C
MTRFGWILAAFAVFVAAPCAAQLASFKHIVIIVQENRTPDNLFWELCQLAACSTTNSQQYDIQTTNWNNSGESVSPRPVDLAIGWDIEHHHDPDWVAMCDENVALGVCNMDGAAGETCKNGGSKCPNLPEFTYVQRYNGPKDVLGPYIDLAMSYGWANKMFATNQGPSFPAHQFIYGGTSAPTSADDDSGTYAAENLGGKSPNGCLADPDALIALITNGDETSSMYPCFQHPTLGTLLTKNDISWKYYTPGEGNLWTAPDALISECGGSNQNQPPHKLLKACPGPEFASKDPNVVTDPKQVLADVANCQLQSVNWVIPRGQYSDHAGRDTDRGPQWVANVVNAIGTSSCADNGSTYWQDTAIVITWDDWGGWYDHEAPILNLTQGYQLGFRVPLLFVSAYGPNNSGGQCVSYINGADILDFGSIANFVEANFLGVQNEGILGFADARALDRGGSQDLSDFYNLNQEPCAFQQIGTEVNAQYFLQDRSPVLPPDDE